MIFTKVQTKTDSVLVIFIPNTDECASLPCQHVTCALAPVDIGCWCSYVLSVSETTYI